MARSVFESFMCVGNYVINIDHIIYVDLHESKQDYVLVALNSGDNVNCDDYIAFDGDQADALRWLLSPAAGNHSLGDITDLYRAFKQTEVHNAE